MSARTESLSMTIGGRVRQERTSRGWTLDRLADQAGISRRMVVNVEQGSANPSIATLLSLSDALGIGLPALVEPPERTVSALTRAGEGALLWEGGNGGRGFLVAATEPPDVVELWDWTLEPGDSHQSTAHSNGTRELLLVGTGTLTLSIGADIFELEPGDAMSFAGDEPHAYENRTQDTATFTLSVFEPGVGTELTTGHGLDDSHD